MIRPKKEDLVGEALIYERADGVTYARFRDAPKNQIYPGRWEIGREVDPNSPLFDYAKWQHMNTLAQKYPTLQKQIDKCIDIYLLVKDEEPLS